MSEPVGYALGVQQRRLVVGGGSGRVVALGVALPEISSAQVPARLAAAVARHEVFRSTLQSAAALKEPLQMVHEQADTGCEQLPEDADPGAALMTLAMRVDVTTGPVLSTAVLRSTHGCTLLLAASAVFSDLATLASLAAEVGGVTPVEDPIQYAEYAAWQADLVAAESQDAPAAAEVWARLSDPDSSVGGSRVPALGEDANHVEDPTSDQTSEKASDQIGGLAPAEITAEVPGGVDPLAWWLARWAVTLARLTGDPEVTVGVELDPRTDPQLEGAAGPYARLVPLTVQVPVSGPLTGVVARVAESLEQARTWMEWAPPADDLPVVVAAGAVAGRVDRPASVQLELRVDLTRRAAAVVAGPGGSAGLAARAGRALSRVARASGDAVEELDVLDAADVAALLGPAPSVTVAAQPVVAHVLAHAASRPDHVALTDGRTSLTYADLAARVDRLAGALGAAGGRAPVVVHLPRSLTALVAMLAAQRAGLGYVALDVDSPLQRAALQAATAGATVWVTDGAAPDGATVVPPLTVPAGGDHGVTPVTHVPSIEDLAYVLFTSGSTGVPKGVAVGQDALAGYAAAITATVESAVGRPGSELVWGQVSGLTTDLGNTAVYGALASGGTLHLVPTELLQDPTALSAHLAATPVDVLKITPTHLRALLGDPRAAVLPRELLVLGGEALTRDLVDQVAQRGSCRVVNHYGPTETTVGALTHSVPEGADPQVPAASTVPVGRPLAGYEALVVDSRLRLVPPGAVGELLIAGVGLARGYLGDDTATTAGFVPHPYRDGARAYRTGDLVSRGDDGAITFLGRRDAQLKVRGFRVEPSEVELALTRHPSVRRAAVVLRSDVGPEPVLVGYVVTQVNPSPDEAQLRAHLAELLPEHMVPSRIVDLGTLPLRANGKLDTSALPVPPQAASTAAAPLQGETEEAVAAIFCAALGVRAVGAHDDFFALGGHSLLATRVVVELRERLGVQLAVYTLFDAPTVRQLADAVEVARGGPSAEELARMIAEISSLSDEEAAALLAEESSGATVDDRPDGAT